MVLTKEENELLTRTGPGTPCGDLLRRYWQPAALSEELPPGGAPIPVRLLGEDLVMFRDEQGSPGLLGLHCSHRGADLSYGRLEDGGLRCIYHGWLYDRTGRCLEQPGEPAGSTFHERIRQAAYPCEERNGVIFAYLGPGEPPLVPAYDFLLAPEEHVFPTKHYSECNYLQGNEGNIDLLHVSFLHHSQRDLLHLGDSANGPDALGAPGMDLSHRGAAPFRERCEAKLADLGLRVCKIRTVNDEEDYLRVGTFIMPNSYAFPAGGLNWHVPIDDTHHWKYVVSFDKYRAYNKEELRQVRDRMTPSTDFHPIPNKANRYHQDRESMRAVSYCGIRMDWFAAQDLCATEGAGPIQDRTQEHLPVSDAPVVAARTLMAAAIKDVKEGRDPVGVIRDPEKNRKLNIVATYGVVPNTTHWNDHCERLLAEDRGWVGRPDGNV
jgi:nitrite reductase/ring-hydroxylating ferredoxin subunit